jgi:molybdopterin molybdotransferase
MDKGFFHVVSVHEFLELCQKFSPVSRTKSLDLTTSLGAVLAQDILANEDLPPFSRSSMDGYALRSADTFGASETNPVYLHHKESIVIHRLPSFALQPGECASLVTGAGLPNGADSVVMVEYTQELGAGEILIHRAVAPGENIMLQGEDCLAGEAQLFSGTRLGPKEISLLAALGYPEILTYEPVQVGIISTGDEIVPVHERPKPGQIRDVNTYSLDSWIRRAGAQSHIYGIIPDDLNQLEQVLSTAVLENDMVMISGGSSVGMRDLTLEAIQRMPEAHIAAHGVALSPGKPTILAQSGNTPILGLPGQVTSAQVVMLVLGIPFLCHLSGERMTQEAIIHPSVPATMSRNVASQQGREDYVRVRLTWEEDIGHRAHPLLGKSGLLKTLLQADGLVRIHASSEGLRQDEQVMVWTI